MKGFDMELPNKVTETQSVPVQTERRPPQAESAPKPEVKIKLETAKEKSVEDDKPIESENELKSLIDKLNRALDPFNTSIRFGFDSQDDIFYVSVIETHTDKMIRRFPATEANSLATKMNEIVGIIFDEKG